MDESSGQAAPNGADDTSPPSASTPAFGQVKDFLLFGLSLPERTLRSTSAVVGGALRESASLLVPQAFQSSTSYSIFVDQLLDLMVKDIGGVAHDGAEEDADPAVENYVARKAVGNFVELAGMATLHLSPMTVLAIVSDVAYGSQTYLKELADDLKRRGVIDENSTIDHAADLLDAVRDASGTTAQAFDTPPLSVDGLKATIEQTREAVGRVDPTTVIPQAEMQRMWDEMHEMANREGVGVLDISSAMTLYSLGRINAVATGALSTVTVAGNLLHRNVFQHYSDALGDIRQRGLFASLAETSKPYTAAVWQNFSSEKTTITQDVLSGKLLGDAYAGMRRWLGGKPEDG